MYEIDKQIEELIAASVDEETGEINESAFEALDALQMERVGKIEAIGLYYKNQVALADAIKAEKQVLADRQKRVEKKAESLKRYMQKALAGEKFQTPKIAVSYRKSQSVDIVTPELLPSEYWRQRDPEPDKTLICDALKAGNIVPGACMVDTVSMSIK